MSRCQFQSMISKIQLKHCLNLMQEKNSLNGVQKLYPRGTILFGVQIPQMGYCTLRWGTVGNPVGYSQGTIYWFDPISFTLLRNTSVWTNLSLALYRDSVFTSKDGTHLRLMCLINKLINRQ